MKKSDIALLGMIIVVSLAVAYFVGQAILGQTKKGIVQVEAVDAISSQVVPPSAKIFNKEAINPAVPIDIGGKPTNQQLFGQ